jgi:outer membrane autotransporter protein
VVVLAFGRRNWFRSSLASALLLSCAGWATSAGAADFTVSNTADSGAGSLRQAIVDSNAAGGSNRIILNSGLGTITLTSGDLPTVANNATIVGNNNTLSGNNQYRGLFVGAFSGTTQTAVSVSISNLTITNTRAVGGAGNDSSNSAGGGGAGLGGALFIANQATVSVSNVTLSGNTAIGGAGGTGGFGGGTSPYGGGGGMGGAAANGGGGGLGSGATGGGPAQPGIATGGASGGTGGNGVTGGAAGGGGGRSTSSFGTKTGGGGGGVGGGNGSSISGAGGSGGFGGGGGGSNGGSENGGNGGFGGGGGAGSGASISSGGNGGFGGGGGGGDTIGGAGGFGGGNGGADSGFGGDGGGGLGAGGAIFVQQGGTLTLAGPLTVNGNSATKGLGGSGGTGADGSAFGAGLFLQGNGTLTFSPGTGQSQTVSDVIADQTGSGGTGGNAGSWALSKTGAGTTILSAANTYTGGTTVTGGLINFSAASNFGSGTVTLNGGGLQWATGTTTDISGRLAAIGSNGATFDTNGNNVSFATALSGGALTKAGTGTLTLNGSNSYTGGTTVNAGTLRLGAGASIASSSALTVNTGGTFDLNGQNQTLGSLSGTGGTVALGSGGLTVGDASSTSFAGAITGTGSFVKQGGGKLILSGANTYTGATTINAGSLAVNGSLTSNTTVNAGGTLQGTGTIVGNVTVAGNIAPGNSIGTINITGTYTQNAGSTYTVEVNPAGQSDKINVTGNAVLNGGTVSVQAQNGTYARNTAYTIVSATGGVAGTYAGVTSNFAFLIPSLSYGTNDVTLTLSSNGNSFRDGARTPNQFAVGTALDLASPTAAGDFANVLAALYGLSTTQGPAALDAIGGQSYAGFSSMTLAGIQAFMNSFSVHAGGSGGAGLGAGLPGDNTYMALRGDSDACDAACDAESLWGVWGNGLGAFGSVAGDGNAAGLTYSLGGFVAGIDRKFGPSFRAGLSSGYNAATLYTNGLPGTGTSNTVQIALYGAYLQDAFYLDGLAGYARSDNRMTRPLAIPGLPFRVAQGSTTANTFFGQVEGGYKLVVAPRFGGFLTPFARLQGVTSTQDGFSESGADSLNLSVAGQTTNSLRTVMGAQLGAGLDAPWREKLNVVFRLGWSHEFADLTRPVTATFAGAPALAFTTQGAAAPRDGVVLGLGANTALDEHATAYLRYDADLSGGNTNHALSAGVRYVW